MSNTVKKYRGLTLKQLRFREAGMADPSGEQTEWALAAGYSKAAAKYRARDNMKHPEIGPSIDKRREDLVKRLELTTERVLQEVTLVAFARLGDFFRIGADGLPYVNLEELSDEQKAVLGEITVDQYVEGKGEDTRQVKKVKIKLHSKLDALEKLMKHLELYPSQKHLHGHMDLGEDGQPTLTDTERVQRFITWVVREATGRDRPGTTEGNTALVPTQH